MLKSRWCVQLKPGFELRGPGIGLPRRGDMVMTSTRSVQVSGVRFQQLNSTRYAKVAHEMDFLPLLLAFSCNQISVHVSVFTDT